MIFIFTKKWQIIFRPSQKYRLSMLILFNCLSGFLSFQTSIQKYTQPVLAFSRALHPPGLRASGNDFAEVSSHLHLPSDLKMAIGISSHLHAGVAKPFLDVFEYIPFACSIEARKCPYGILRTKLLFAFKAEIEIKLIPQEDRRLWITDSSEFNATALPGLVGQPEYRDGLY